jgi:hypothetical protein
VLTKHKEVFLIVINKNLKICEIVNSILKILWLYYAELRQLSLAYMLVCCLKIGLGLGMDALILRHKDVSLFFMHFLKIIF